jgi:hypothetical protein
MALAGIWMVLVAVELKKRPLVPVNDPNFRTMLANPNGGH